MGSSESATKRVTIEREEDNFRVSESWKTSHEKSIIGKPAEKMKEDEFLRLQALYMARIEELELKNAQSFQVSLRKLEKAVEDVELKHMKPTTAPVCADVQEVATRCLLANQRHSLNCAAEVRAFNQCVKSQRQKVLT